VADHFLQYISLKFGTFWETLLLLTAGLSSIAFQIWQQRRIRTGQAVPPEKARQKFAQRLVADPEVPFLGVSAAVTFGLWHLGVAYSVRKGLQSVGINPWYLSNEVLWQLSAVWGLLIGTVFYVGFSLPALVSASSFRRRIARVELATYALIAYISMVILYSQTFYWKTPQILGGGKPQAISIWIDASGTNLDLMKLLPNAQCIRDLNQWMCSSAHLLDASGENLILLDDAAFDANSLLIAKAKVLAIGKSRAR
jgi:hypothetical protein